MTQTITNTLFATMLFCHVLSHNPQVTLSHGGKLVGLSTISQNTPLDIFLAVRYAQAPIGDLRFQRPVEVPVSDGPIDATKIGNICPQVSFDESSNPIEASLSGSEDCLMLDVYVPGGVSIAYKKAVMVWMHGGGFYMGSGLGYPMGPLAVIGDVIVVSINYRLGPLGFLTDGAGTGNLGLWDQRAALLWIKKNIAAFGGDPDMVTIFGESAGGASVSAQTLGLLNDGLFRRAIQQSGTLMQIWAFYKSRNDLHQNEMRIRAINECEAEVTVYECLRHKPLAEVFKSFSPYSHMYHPFPDGDFLPADLLSTESYNLSRRFDLMSGMNGQEGGIAFFFDVSTVIKDFSTAGYLDKGIPLDKITDYLIGRCAAWMTKFSPELCADFIIRTYAIDEADISDKERTIQLISFLGEINHDVDVVNNLEQHSLSDQSFTYAYYFNSFAPNIKLLWSMPEWAKRSADHGDELSFVFGAPFIHAEGEPELWKEILKMDPLAAGLNYEPSQSEDELARAVITMWTNFAKTGNPNKPTPLTVEWPEFKAGSNLFYEMSSDGFKAIPTPNKERIRKTLFAARRRELLADNPITEGTKIK